MGAYGQEGVEYELMSEWEYIEVLVTAGGDGSRVLVDGEEASGDAEHVLADLWEQGWKPDALWMRVVRDELRWREIPHQARLRRRRRA